MILTTAGMIRQTAMLITAKHLICVPVRTHVKLPVSFATAKTYFDSHHLRNKVDAAPVFVFTSVIWPSTNEKKKKKNTKLLIKIISTSFESWIYDYPLVVLCMCCECFSLEFLISVESVSFSVHATQHFHEGIMWNGFHLHTHYSDTMLSAESLVAHWLHFSPCMHSCLYAVVDKIRYRIALSMLSKCE